MTRRDDTIALRHMLAPAEEVVRAVQGRTRTNLDDDRLLALALIKLVEIVGEAAHRVSAATQGANDQIPWSQIVGTRNRLVHGYDQVDYDVLWRIVRDEPPVVVGQLRTILSNTPRTEP